MKKILLNENGPLIFFVLILIFFAGICCSSGVMLKSKKINTGKELSSGILCGDKIYFLCDYTLYESGRIVVPMYISTPGKIHYNTLRLYSFDIKDEILTPLAALQSPAINKGKKNISITDWACIGSDLYVAYNSGWDSASKTSALNMFRIDLNSNSTEEVTGDEKKKKRDQIFGKDITSSREEKRIIKRYEIQYHVGVLRSELWQLPEALEFSGTAEKEYAKIIIERFGDKYFRQAVLKKIIASANPDELLQIASDMRKHGSSLSGYNKALYLPYMEEWVSRISIEAKYWKGQNAGEVKTLQGAVLAGERSAVERFLKEKSDINKPDSDGLTPLMAAAYKNDPEILSLLIDNGAYLNHRDRNGCTPLMYAIFGMAPDAMEILIKNGADKKIESNSGWNAWMFVSTTGLRQRFLKLEGN